MEAIFQGKTSSGMVVWFRKLQLKEWNLDKIITRWYNECLKLVSWLALMDSITTEIKKGKL